jgi:hypothetical protein
MVGWGARVECNLKKQGETSQFNKQNISIHNEASEWNDGMVKYLKWAWEAALVRMIYFVHAACETLVGENRPESREIHASKVESSEHNETVAAADMAKVTGRPLAAYNAFWRR